MDGLDQNAGGTTPLGLFLLACLIGLTWLLSRRNALVPLLITTCYIPLGQHILVGGAHIQFFRILLLVAWCRVIVRRETGGFTFTRIDKIFAWWLVVTLGIGSFTQPSDLFDRFFSLCGDVYNAGATFFLIRCWLRNVKELVALLRIMAWLIIPLAVAMAYERTTGQNIFSALGGVPEVAYMRNGSYRAQGAFRNPLLAGVFGATMLPLFVGLFFQDKDARKRALIGLAGAMTVAVAAASSGAVLSMMGAIISLCLWRIRYSMRAIRWGILLLLGTLALSMNAPVWYVFARVSDIAGGTGWYRSYLIEQAVNHFEQWCYTGSLYTANWAPAGEVPIGNPNNTDIINQFVLEGLQGGLLKVGLFIALIVAGFKNVGRFTRMQTELPFGYRFTIWSLGACLLTHCLSFFSVTYFDQIVIMWYFLLAALAMLQAELQLIQQQENNPSSVGAAF